MALRLLTNAILIRGVYEVSAEQNARWAKKNGEPLIYKN